MFLVSLRETINNINYDLKVYSYLIYKMLKMGRIWIKSIEVSMKSKVTQCLPWWFIALYIRWSDHPWTNGRVMTNWWSSDHRYTMHWPISKLTTILKENECLLSNDWYLYLRGSKKSIVQVILENHLLYRDSINEWIINHPFISFHFSSLYSRKS